MLSVVSLNVVMLSVVAQFNEPSLVENAGDGGGDGNADVSQLESISPTFYKHFICTKILLHSVHILPIILLNFALYFAFKICASCHDIKKHKRISVQKLLFTAAKNVDEIDPTTCLG
jgi:hypothetical protein